MWEADIPPKYKNRIRTNSENKVEHKILQKYPSPGLGASSAAGRLQHSGALGSMDRSMTDR